MPITTSSENNPSNIILDIDMAYNIGVQPL